MTAARFVKTVFWRDAQLAMTSRVPFLFDVLGVLAGLTIYLFVGRFVGRGLGFLAFVTAGIAAMQLQAAVLRGVHGLDREQASGGLEMLFTGPVRPAVVGVSVVSFSLARGAVFATAALVVSKLVFGVGLELGPAAWPGVLVGLAGAAAAFVVIAMVCFCVLIAFRQGPAAASLCGLVLPVLSGVYFPVSLLPEPLETIASASPLTLAIERVRAAVIGGDFSLWRTLVMFAELAVCLALAGALCNLVVNRAKRLGTLGHN
jgi:ABC-type polysaccharide/polyol phosphate export permease